MLTNIFAFLRFSQIEDFIPGGHLYSRIKDNLPTEPAAKLVLAELITTIETLHKAKIYHGDISRFNTLIDSDGHIVLTDFGWSHEITNILDTMNDWERFPRLCLFLFSQQFQDDNKEFIGRFANMTDDQLPGKLFFF